MPQLVVGWNELAIQSGRQRAKMLPRSAKDGPIYGNWMWKMLMNQWIVGYLRYLIFKPESSLCSLCIKVEVRLDLHNFVIIYTKNHPLWGLRLDVGSYSNPLQGDPKKETDPGWSGGRAEMTVVFHGFSVLKEVNGDLQWTFLHLWSFINGGFNGKINELNRSK